MPGATERRPAADRRKGEKRSALVLAETTSALATYIKNNPGERIERIAMSLGEPTRDLALPVKKLLASKRIRKTGVRRATRYYPKAS